MTLFGRYRYRGRHRAPSTAGRTAARLAVAGVSATMPLGLAQQALAEPPGGWAPLIQCESGGRNVESVSPESTASGYFQFLDSTWRGLGGAEFAPRAIEASFEEQLAVAERAFARNGLRDWEATRGCWEDATPASAPAPVADDAPPPPAPAPERAAESTAPQLAPGSVYTVQPGDTLSEIAYAHGTTWPDLFELNRRVVEDPDLIFPCERIRLA